MVSLFTQLKMAMNNIQSILLTLGALFVSAIGLQVGTMNEVLIPFGEANNGINKRNWNEMEIGAVALPTEDEWYKAAYFSGQPAPGDWTDQAPSGWSVSNGNKHGKPVSEESENALTADEFNGWTFHNIKSWSRNDSHKSIRNKFTKGTGTIAVIDPYEFSLETAGVTTQSEISTPSIDISGAVAGELKLNFDSSWARKHTPNHASISVSYDGAAPITIKQFRKEKNTAIMRTKQLISTIQREHNQLLSHGVMRLVKTFGPIGPLTIF